jgi:hypothetical protein
MQIPTSFKLSGHMWKVACKPFGYSNPAIYGAAVLSAHYIVIYNRAPGTRNAERKRAETFWHEATHAILYDMDHPLARNETFVTDFSRRLNELVHTAELPK